MAIGHLYRVVGLTAAIALGSGGSAAIVQAATNLPASPTSRHRDSGQRVARQDSLATPYNLGDAILIQNRFPEDSRFREMPVRLNGLIGVPPTPGPHPLVIIVHGTHPGCPTDAAEVDRWPCDPEVEQPNYQGFGYLIDRLAAEGYLALAINLNAENTFGFGEADPGERLTQLIDLHLGALATASDGGSNGFGVDLSGQVDWSRMAIIGHSRGGEAAYWLAHKPDFGNGFSQPSADGGPLVDGILMVAPANVFVPAAASAMPLGILMAACDDDVTDQSGHVFYEQARLEPDQRQWTTSVWLEQANHNHFNTVLNPGFISLADRPDCETILTGEAQRDFLASYAVDFLAAVFSPDAATAQATWQRLGLDSSRPASSSLYQQGARVAHRVSDSNRKTLLVPADAAELATHRLGGDVSADRVSLTFCPAGYYTPAQRPEAAPCRRVSLTNPGQPALAVASWWRAEAAWRFALPEGAGNLSNATAISLRAAIDPLSPLNPVGQPQSFSVRLTDGSGRQAAVATDPLEPTLQYPPGLVIDNEVFAGGTFTGPVPLTTIRLPMNRFSGVNLSDIREVAIVFDRAPSGALFVADLEWIGKAAQP